MKKSVKKSIFCLPFAWHQTGNTFTCGGETQITFFLGGKPEAENIRENLCYENFIWGKI